MKLSQTYLTFISLPTATITENHLCPEVKYSVFQPEMWMFWQCCKSIKGEVLFEIVLEPKLFGALLGPIIMEECVGRCSKATQLPHLTRVLLISWAVVTGWLHKLTLPCCKVKPISLTNESLNQSNSLLLLTCLNHWLHQCLNFNY